jgi:hypothetical protein
MARVMTSPAAVQPAAVQSSMARSRGTATLFLKQKFLSGPHTSKICQFVNKHYEPFSNPLTCRFIAVGDRIYPLFQSGCSVGIRAKARRLARIPFIDFSFLQFFSNTKVVLTSSLSHIRTVYSPNMA